MRFDTKDKQAVLFAVALAILPLLFGNAFHQRIPHSYPVRFNNDRSSCCTHVLADDQEQPQESESDKPASSENPCPVCEFLSMACDVASTAVNILIFHHVEQRESQPVCPYVVLYRPFEPGRAPPTPV